MITEINIKNFKSIVDLTLPLSNINVFIGENGCGKTNILEAVAFLSLALTKKVDNESLISKGVRAAKSALTFNSFIGKQQSQSILFSVTEDNQTERLSIKEGKKDSVFPVWEVALKDKFKLALDKLLKEIGEEELIRRIQQYEIPTDITITEVKDFIYSGLSHWWQDYAVFTPNTLALRGLQVESYKEPVGIFGENLDVFLDTLSKDEKRILGDYTHLINWLDDFEFDEGDKYKYQEYKSGRSKSRLYFRDKFMQKRNNMFSAENANEGVLYILFYLALFISSRTPRFFAIDNIETALNPRLCRTLMKSIIELAVKNNKQALITTHNPAILDGLNLHDDRQRLFVVKRNDAGHTKIERITLKPDANGEQLRLSELWMRGYLGAIPNHF